MNAAHRLPQRHRTRAHGEHRGTGGGSRVDRTLDANPGMIATSTLNDGVCGERCEPSAVAQHKTVNTGTLPNRRQSRVRSPAVRFVRGTVHARTRRRRARQPAAAARAAGARAASAGARSETQVSVVFSSCILSRTLFDLISPAPPRHICMRDAARFVHWSRAQGRRPLLFRGSPRSPHARGATARANAFLSVGDTTGGDVRACGSVSSHGLPFVVKITPAILTALHLGGRGLLHASCGHG